MVEYLSDNPWILDTLIVDKVRDISKNLYEKYGIEEKDMLYACQITYEQDK